MRWMVRLDIDPTRLTFTGEFEYALILIGGFLTDKRP